MKKVVALLLVAVMALSSVPAIECSRRNEGFG